MMLYFLKFENTNSILDFTFSWIIFQEERCRSHWAYRIVWELPISNSGSRIRCWYQTVSYTGIRWEHLRMWDWLWNICRQCDPFRDSRSEAWRKFVFKEWNTQKELNGAVLLNELMYPRAFWLIDVKQCVPGSSYLCALLCTQSQAASLILSSRSGHKMTFFFKLQVTHRQTSRCIETQSMSTLNPHSTNGVLGQHEPNIVLPCFTEAPEIRFSCRSSVYNQTLTDTTPWFRRTCRQIKVLQHAARGASNSAPRRDSLPCNDYTSIYKHCAKHMGYSGGSMFKETSWKCTKGSIISTCEAAGNLGGSRAPQTQGFRKMLRCHGSIRNSKKNWYG